MVEERVACWVGNKAFATKDEADVEDLQRRVNEVASALAKRKDLLRAVGGNFDFNADAGKLYEAAKAPARALVVVCDVTPEQIATVRVPAYLHLTEDGLKRTIVEKGPSWKS